MYVVCGPIPRLAAILYISMLVGASAISQDGSSDIHVRPGVHPGVHGDYRFGVDVNLVLVPVAVQDRRGAFVAGLQKRNFELYEDKVQQRITLFSQEDEPISVGIILDTSGSMKGKLETAREAVAEFLNISNRKDEFFFVTFSDEPRVALDFTTAAGNIQGMLPEVAAKGDTALLDAIYLGLDHMRGAQYRRRALLIVSDGGDNRSRYSKREIKRVAQESDMQIFSIGTYSDSPLTSEEVGGPSLLRELADITGGQSYPVRFAQDLPSIAASIGHILRNEYVIGYIPPAGNRGKWHKVQVKVVGTERHFLTVHAKSGYFSAR